jgi:hypothetical protein
MTQERMHPDDLRAIVASNMWGGGMPLEWAMKSADLLFAELARTAKPEDEPEFLAWRQKAWDNASRAEKAEARVKELEAKEGLISDEVLDQLQNARDRIHDLEDAIKKHRSIVKGSHHWRGCDWDEELWSKAK